MNISQVYVDHINTQLKENGGVTVSYSIKRTEAKFSLQTFDHGYQLGIGGCVIDSDQITAEDLKYAINNMVNDTITFGFVGFYGRIKKQLYNQYKYNLGFWVDEGKTYIDLSLHLTCDLNKALAFATILGEKSIYDWKRKICIYTNKPTDLLTEYYQLQEQNKVQAEIINKLNREIEGRKMAIDFLKDELKILRGE